MNHEARLAAAIKKILTPEYLASTVQLSCPDDESVPDWGWAAESLADWLAQELADEPEMLTAASLRAYRAWLDKQRLEIVSLPNETFEDQKRHFAELILAVNALNAFDTLFGGELLHTAHVGSSMITSEDA